MSGKIIEPFISLITPLFLTDFHLSSFPYITVTLTCSPASLILGLITSLICDIIDENIECFHKQSNKRISLYKKKGYEIYLNDKENEH